MCSTRTRSRSDSSTSTSDSSISSSSSGSLSSASSVNGGKKRVVILNSTPSGLLAAIYLLRRPGHSVTVLSPSVDIGLFSPDELSRNRGTMIGLSKSGLSAFHAIPELWEKYIRPIEYEAMDFVPDDSGAMTIDENYLCWALSRYLHDNFIKNRPLQDCTDDDDEPNEFVAHYGVKADLVADKKDKAVIFRQWYDIDEDDADETKVEYDLLMQ